MDALIYMQLNQVESWNNNRSMLEMEKQKQKNGEIEKWRNREMEKWRNGEMEKWKQKQRNQK